ncbi:hypothetical protein SeLEV6574_g08126 [Synchytrium endobioticum]|uniref:Rho-GAP domain-containing protein n=1 Tax=Synchytrium endobioticum TaxID=286115 RepID=A0A507CEB3_9FUNG|nr:hypothetical protein SeLEV6574_g08126 [Synchytrium endobioticum]
MEGATGPHTHHGGARAGIGKGIGTVNPLAPGTALGIRSDWGLSTEIPPQSDDLLTSSLPRETEAQESTSRLSTPRRRRHRRPGHAEDACPSRSALETHTRQQSSITAHARQKRQDSQDLQRKRPITASAIQQHKRTPHHQTFETAINVNGEQEESTKNQDRSDVHHDTALASASPPNSPVLSRNVAGSNTVVNPWTLEQHLLQQSALHLMICQKMDQRETASPLISKPLPPGGVLTTNPVKLFYATPSLYAGYTLDLKIGRLSHDRPRTPSGSCKKTRPLSPSRQLYAPVGHVEGISAEGLHMSEHDSRQPSIISDHGREAEHVKRHLSESQAGITLQDAFSRPPFKPDAPADKLIRSSKSVEPDRPSLRVLTPESLDATVVKRPPSRNDENRGRPLFRASNNPTLRSDLIAKLAEKSYATHPSTFHEEPARPPPRSGDSQYSSKPFLIRPRSSCDGKGGVSCGRNKGSKQDIPAPSIATTTSGPTSRGYDYPAMIQEEGTTDKTVTTNTRRNSSLEDCKSSRMHSTHDDTKIAQHTSSIAASKLEEICNDRQSPDQRPKSRQETDAERPVSRLGSKPTSPSRLQYCSDIHNGAPSLPKHAQWAGVAVSVAQDKDRIHMVTHPRPLTADMKRSTTRSSRSMSPPTRGTPHVSKNLSPMNEVVDRRRARSAGPSHEAAEMPVPKPILQNGGSFQFNPHPQTIRTNILKVPNRSKSGISVFNPFLPSELAASSPKVRGPPPIKKAAPNEKQIDILLRLGQSRKMSEAYNTAYPESQADQQLLDGAEAEDTASSPGQTKSKLFQPKLIRRPSSAPQKPMPTWRPGGSGDPVKRNEFLRNRERAKQIAQLLRRKLFANDSDSDSDDSSIDSAEVFFPSNLPKFTGDRESIVSRLIDDGLEEEVEVDEEQHSSQYYKMMFLNEFVQLDRRDSDMRDNQRAFIIRDTSIVPTKMITRLTEEDAAQFCWHMYRYVRSLTDNPLPASVTLEILRVAENNDDDESIAASLKRVVCKLPRSEYLLTKAFFSHLQRLEYQTDSIPIAPVLTYDNYEI